MNNTDKMLEQQLVEMLNTDRDGHRVHVDYTNRTWRATCTCGWIETNRNSRRMTAIAEQHADGDAELDEHEITYQGEPTDPTEAAYYNLSVAEQLTGSHNARMATLARAQVFATLSLRDRA